MRFRPPQVADRPPVDTHHPRHHHVEGAKGIGSGKPVYLYRSPIHRTVVVQPEFSVKECIPEFQNVAHLPDDLVEYVVILQSHDIRETSPLILECESDPSHTVDLRKRTGYGEIDIVEEDPGKVDWVAFSLHLKLERFSRELREVDHFHVGVRLFDLVEPHRPHCLGHGETVITAFSLADVNLGGFVDLPECGNDGLHEFLPRRHARFIRRVGQVRFDEDGPGFLEIVSDRKHLERAGNLLPERPDIPLEAIEENGGLQSLFSSKPIPFQGCPRCLHVRLTFMSCS